MYHTAFNCVLIDKTSCPARAHHQHPHQGQRQHHRCPHRCHLIQCFKLALLSSKVWRQCSKQLQTCIQKKHFASHKHLATTRHRPNHHSDVLRCTTICHLQKPLESHLQAMPLWKDFVNPSNLWPSIVHTNAVKENEVISSRSTRTSCDTTCRWTLQCPLVHDSPTVLPLRRLKLRTTPSTF